MDNKDIEPSLGDNAQVIGDEPDTDFQDIAKICVAAGDIYDDMECCYALNTAKEAIEEKIKLILKDAKLKKSDLTKYIKGKNVESLEDKEII